jgi:hypothetical protein
VVVTGLLAAEVSEILQTRPDIEQTFAGQASHLLKKETILDRCRRFASRTLMDPCQCAEPTRRETRPLAHQSGLVSMAFRLVLSFPNEPG